MPSNAPLPVAYQILRSEYSNLDSNYGYRRIQTDRDQYLLVRTPNLEFDLVRESQEAAERIPPTEFGGVKRVIFMTPKAIHLLPPQEMEIVSRHKLAFDLREIQDLRQTLPGTLTTHLYKSLRDPKRKLRLAIRIPAETLVELPEPLLNQLAMDLGPRLERGELADVAIVYLIATRNHVTIDPLDLIPEMEDRYSALRQASQRATAQRAQNISAPKPRITEVTIDHSRVLDEVRASLERRSVETRYTGQPEEVPRVRTRLAPSEPIAVEEQLGAITLERRADPRTAGFLESARAQLVEQGYEVRDISKDPRNIGQLAAANLGGKRVVVNFFEEPTVDSLGEWLDRLDQVGGDTWYAIARNWPSGSTVRALGTPARLLKPHEIDQIGMH